MSCFRNYEQYIHFAVLSLDGRGAASWGDCALTLRDELIEDRASVFEENCLYFCRKQLATFDDSVAPGNRALWKDRHRLAAAKLGSHLRASTNPTDYPGILLSSSRKDHGEDFVEVHIYGPVHRRTVEHLVVKQPKRKQDRLILRALRAKLKRDKVEISVEMAS